MKQFLKYAFMSLLLLGVTACGGSDSDGEPTPPPAPPAVADYTALHDLASSCSAQGDYCKSVSVTSTGITLKSVSGKSATAVRGDVPYLTVSVTTPRWTVNGKLIAAETPADVRLHAPTVTAGSDGNLMVDGQDMGVKAGTGLLCVINAIKHVYLYFSSGTVTWGSEMYQTYNPPLTAGDNEINILFIGNSFTQDATEHLPALINASGISNVHMTRLFHGGYTLPEYAANFSQPNICAARPYHPGYTGWGANETLDDSPAAALASRQWDIVVLQEHTGRKEGWEWPGTLKGALGSLIDIILAAQPQHRPTIAYIMSQTYSNGSNVLTTSFSNNRSMMFSTTTYVAKHVLDETMIDIVISTGATLENLRTTSLCVNNGMQLTRDSYHMDYGISRYAAACAVFETLITPTTGKSIDDCNWTFATSNTTAGSYTTPVTDANAPIARAAAHAAVEKPFEVTDLSHL